MMVRGGGVRRRLVHGILGALVLAGVLSGCTSARSSLGTNDSSCFLDVPTASSAVHNHGTFKGIHLYSLAQLTKAAPHLVHQMSEAHETAPHVCVAAYSGSFSAGSVSKPIGRQSGKLAVVVVNAANRKLLGTVIFKRLPVRFSHTHLG
jgi:hypothetical protein